MINSTKLKMHTVKDLAEMAKRKGVSGWHSMRKDQLIRALVKRAKAGTAAVSKRGTCAEGKKSAILHRSGVNGDSLRTASQRREAARKARSACVEGRLKQIKAKLAQSKDLALKCIGQGDGGYVRDRLVLMVRDPYWLHVYWELTRQSIQRARVAMGQHWHGARPVLRLHEISAEGTTGSARRVVRHIHVHGGVNNWYVDVQDPPKRYQMDIGYVARSGKFYCLARSNTVSTPLTKTGDAFDRNWAGVAQDYDRIYAMSGGYGTDRASGELREVFEEQLRRPMGTPMVTRFGLGAGAAAGTDRQFNFAVDAELVVFGATDPDAHVTLRGEPVRLQPDGSFMVRFSLPERRHVLPVVASSGDGAEQRTIVLAVERNTKVMEPVIRESGE